MSEPVTGERAAFTAWFNDAHSNTNITWINPNWPCGHPDVEAAWDAWQGARATLTRERDEAVASCQAAIRDAATITESVTRLYDEAVKDLASARTALAEAKGVDPAMAEYVAASLAWWLDESEAAERLEGAAWERFHAAYYALSPEARRGGR